MEARVQSMSEKTKSARRYSGWRWKWLREGRRFLLLVAAAVLIFRFVIGFSVVDGVSMSPTLQSGDVVLYTRIHSDVRRGDVLSVKLTSGEYYVKRAVALAGDVVDLADGVLTVNGQPETGDYVHGQTLAEDGSVTYPYTVEEGCAFVVGDNREQSVDSRFFGAVKLSQVRGVLCLSIGKNGFQGF